MGTRNTFPKYGDANSAYAFDQFGAQKLEGSTDPVQMPAVECEMVFIAITLTWDLPEAAQVR